MIVPLMSLRKRNRFIAADPASYVMADPMGRMYSDAQFACSSSVPAYVEIMDKIIYLMKRQSFPR